MVSYLGSRTDGTSQSSAFLSLHGLIKKQTTSRDQKRNKSAKDKNQILLSQ